MSNVGRTISDFYCNGYFGREYDLSGAVIITDEDEYMIIRKKNGLIEFASFQNYEWNRNEDGTLAGGVNNLGYMDPQEKQKLIDSWCS